MWYDVAYLGLQPRAQHVVYDIWKDMTHSKYNDDTVMNMIYNDDTAMNMVMI